MGDKKRQPVPLWAKIIFGVFLLLLVCAIATSGNNNKKTDEKKEDKTSVYDAQTKCMLMEEADRVNYMGDPFGEETTKKAQEFCLSQWDKTKNPDNSEEEFIKIVEMDWVERKNEVLEGHTLEELYNESIK